MKQNKILKLLHISCLALSTLLIEEAYSQPRSSIDIFWGYPWHVYDNYSKIYERDFSQSIGAFFNFKSQGKGGFKIGSFYETENYTERYKYRTGETILPTYLMKAVFRFNYLSFPFLFQYKVVDMERFDICFTSGMSISKLLNSERTAYYYNETHESGFHERCIMPNWGINCQLSCNLMYDFSKSFSFFIEPISRIVLYSEGFGNSCIADEKRLSFLFALGTKLYIPAKK